MTKSVRIAPGLEVEVDDDTTVTAVGAVIRDPLGGYPLNVSSRLQPDPMAIYLLAIAILEATRVITQHKEEIARHRAAVERAAHWQRRVARLLQAMLVASAATFVMLLFRQIN
jgi:hypothetical protein